MIQSLKDNFDSRFSKGKWFFTLPKKISWTGFFFGLVWGGGFAFAGIWTLLQKMEIVSGNFTESPPGIGWVIGPLFSLIGFIGLLMGLSVFTGSSLEVSKTSIRGRWNFLFFKPQKFAVSKINLKDVRIEKTEGHFSYKIVVVEPSDKEHVAAESDNRPALEELTRFIREYMELD